jgi:plasmid stabilization system protein ParE
MTFRVAVSANAELEIRTAHHFIRSQAPDAASRWVKGVRLAIRSLKRHPEHCPVAPEDPGSGDPVRELFYGSGNRGTYRILFKIVDESVIVLHVRHGSMQALSPEDMLP